MCEAKAHFDLVSCIFELEGSAEFVKEELRELRELLRAGLLPLSPAIEEAPDKTEDLTQAAGLETSGEAKSPSENVLKTKKIKARAKYTPKVLELDLRNNADNSLRAFVDSKKPKTDMDKYEVISHWLKNELGIEEVGPDHMYTCFRALQWRTPKDIAVAFRNAKHHHTSFDLGVEPGHYKLNHIGESRVEHDLPPKI